MVHIHNQTLRTINVTVWDQTAKKEETLALPKGQMIWSTGKEKISHVKWEACDWIAVGDGDYSIYRDVNDKLQLIKGAKFCKKCIEEGIPASSFTNMRCNRCGEKTAFRKKGERIAIEAGAAAALAITLSVILGDD